MAVKHLDLTNLPDEPVDLQAVREILEKDAELSKKLSPLLKLDDLLRQTPIPAPMQKVLDELFRPNDAVVQWTKFLKESMARKLSHNLDGTPNDEFADESTPEGIVLEAIEERVTKVSESGSTRRYLFLDASGHLLDQDDPERTHLLSPHMQRLVIHLEKNCRRTSALRSYAGYKTEPAFYQAVRKLNAIGFGVLKLPTKIAISERPIGFRLAKYITIEVDKRNPNR